MKTHPGYARALCAMQFAVLPLFGLALTALPSPAHSQQYQSAAAAPRIEGFNVDEVRRLAPGVELNFSLYGTPGGTATLRPHRRAQSRHGQFTGGQPGHQRRAQRVAAQGRGPPRQAGPGPRRHCRPTCSSRCAARPAPRPT